LNVLEDLSEHFGQFGEIENINVKVDAATGRARGFAFIVYKTMEGLDNVSTPFNFINLLILIFKQSFLQMILMHLSNKLDDVIY